MLSDGEIDFVTGTPVLFSTTLQSSPSTPDFASRKSKNPNEIKVKEAEKAK